MRFYPLLVTRFPFLKKYANPAQIKAAAIEPETISRAIDEKEAKISF